MPSSFDRLPWDRDVWEEADKTHFAWVGDHARRGLAVVAVGSVLFGGAYLAKKTYDDLLRPEPFGQSVPIIFEEPDSNSCEKISPTNPDQEIAVTIREAEACRLSQNTPWNVLTSRPQN